MEVVVGDVTRRRLLGPLWPVPAARRSIRSLDRGAGGLGWRPGRSDARGSTVQGAPSPRRRSSFVVVV